MEQKEMFEKMAGMVMDGITKVHEKFMAEIEKNDDISLVRDYAMTMSGFATLLTSLGLLKPVVPNLMGFGLGVHSGEKN